MQCRIVLLLIFLTSTYASLAQPITLTGSGRVDVNGNLTYYRDATQTLSLEEVRVRDFTKPESPSSPNIGFDRSAHWFKIDITNQTENPEWLLEVAYAPLDQIDFYIADEDGAILQKTGGDHFPIAQRDLPHRQPVFSFSILPGQSKTLYLRVLTISSVQVPVTVWDRNAFFKTSYTIQLLNGLFYGAMLVMILYQLFLFLSIRDKITFYYVLTLLTMINVVSFFQGYTFLYLFPANPGFNDILAMITGPIFVVCSTLLTRAFLNVRQFSKLLDNLLLGNMFLDLGVAILMTIFFRQISFQYHNYIIFMHCLLALVCAGYCLYRKYKPARYYLIAWFTLLVAAGIFTMSSVGFMPGYLSTNYVGLMTGCVLQMLFISFALGDRWKQLTKENERVKELELKRGQEENDRLEREVKLRTAKLEEANRIKDKLFSVVSHDIKSPLASLKLSLMLAKAGNVNPEEFKHIISGIETHMDQTNEFIQNLLQWAKLQLQGVVCEPQRLHVKALVDEAVNLLEPDFQTKGISIVQDAVPVDAYAWADLNMIRSVIRNLVNNAIKFTPTGGTITITVKKNDPEIVVAVADTGVGIPAAHLDRIFTLESITTLGTRQEAGTGLGLILCREFVEKNKGRIWLETENGLGTIFYFTLPAHNEAQTTAVTSLPSPVEEVLPG
ncbi:MAG: sensor histidine kinase [Cyclobacteriaceae bacterium]|nr:sensor histidine kinase [Cyclobacteriaceae bacterium]